jgi:hypothetical protein
VFEISGGVAVQETTMVVGYVQVGSESFTTIRSRKGAQKLNPQVLQTLLLQKIFNSLMIRR